MKARPDFAERLLEWHAREGRHDLPWQHSRTPYRVWLSEIMLQQTQVATVIPYFLRFEKEFPDVHALASAADDEVMHLWSGLGYYARARNLLKTARVVSKELAGEFPVTLDGLTALPGIGRSTAGAILSLASGIREPILDGNVKRVLARCFAIPGWAGKASVLNELWNKTEELTPAENVATYTQAIMDLGATLCIRSKPACPDCPMLGLCVAEQEGRQTEFPGRKPKRAKPQRETRMIMATHGRRVFLVKRPESGIWGGLWSLPEIDTGANPVHWSEDQLASTGGEPEHWPTLRHSFSHYDLNISPVQLKIPNLPSLIMESDTTLWYNLDTPPAVGLAAPVARLLENLKLRGQTPL